jgi:hypothetical protein
MTYGILSTESGNLLESYRSEEKALEAAARIHETEPEADGSYAVVTFDDAGTPVAFLDGDELNSRLAASSGHAALA